MRHFTLSSEKPARISPVVRIGSLRVKVSTTLVVGVGVWDTPKEVEAVGAVKVEDVVVVVVFMVLLLLVGVFLKN